MNNASFVLIIVIGLILLVALAIGLFLLLNSSTNKPPSIPETPNVSTQTPFGVCTTSADCPYPQVCENNVCTNAKPCISNSECGNLLCKGGLCVPCKSGVDVIPNFTCMNGRLVPSTCNTQHDCSEGAACINGTCSSCTSNSSCLPGYYCLGGKCIKESPSTVQEVRQEIVAPECTSDNQCLNGMYCLSGRCVEKPGRCVSDNQCLNGMVCSSGYCTEKNNIPQTQTFTNIPQTQPPPIVREEISAPPMTREEVYSSPMNRNNTTVREEAPISDPVGKNTAVRQEFYSSPMNKGRPSNTTESFGRSISLADERSSEERSYSKSLTNPYDYEDDYTDPFKDNRNVRKAEKTNVYSNKPVRKGPVKPTGIIKPIPGNIIGNNSRGQVIGWQL